MRQPTVEPDPPLIDDDSVLKLPPPEGEILWAQDWQDCRLQLLDPPWSKDKRGARGFSFASDELCDHPGRIRGGTPQSGTLQTLVSAEGMRPGDRLDARAVRDPIPKGRLNHTNFELHFDASGEGGRSLEIGGSYRLLFWLNPVGEAFKAPTSKWLIAHQLKSFPEPGEANSNPTLTLMIKDGALLGECSGRQSQSHDRQTL